MHQSQHNSNNGIINHSHFDLFFNLIVLPISLSLIDSCTCIIILSEWGIDRGRPVLVPESGQLKRKFEEAVTHQDGLTWGKKEVEETIVDLVGNHMASHPTKKTIEASLGVIANYRGHTLGISKGKKGHRRMAMADESEHSMLAEVATQLVAQIIVDPDGIPTGYDLSTNASKQQAFRKRMCTTPSMKDWCLQMMLDLSLNVEAPTLLMQMRYELVEVQK